MLTLLTPIHTGYAQSALATRLASRVVAARTNEPVAVANINLAEEAAPEPAEASKPAVVPEPAAPAPAPAARRLVDGRSTLPGAPKIPPKVTRRKAEWLPGADAPVYLDGTLAGDRGFDPYCLVALARTNTEVGTKTWVNAERETQMVLLSGYERQRKVMWMREAEIKHSRLAMMAAAGWPLSELLDKPLSNLLGLPSPLDATGGRAPSLLNGHLLEGPQGVFVVLVALATAYLELNTLDNVQGLTPSGYVPGDLGFDPLGLKQKRPDMELAEIKHGRLAMMAVAGYVVQELVYGTPVVEQTPQFFKPFFLL